ncbi:MAG: M48 family metalloprotease [Thermoleophilaceae bacterium]
MSRRARRWAWAVAALVAAGAWVWLASRLWRTSVPGDLRLPDLSASNYFSHAELDRTRTFERFERIDFLLSQAALVLALLVYSVRGRALVRESAAGPIGTGLLLGMLAFGVVWLAQLPFEVAGVWWEHHYGVSKAGVVESVVDSWLSLGSVFLFVCVAIAIVMGLARPLGNRWWLAGAPVFVALGLLFTWVQPYLIPDVHRLRDPRLTAEARQLARTERLPPIPVDVEDVHKFTDLPNAEAVGLGGSRRVVLWDTLLNDGFGPRQIRTVLAHELGHHAHGHLWKQVGWSALTAFPLAFLIALATARVGGMRVPTAVPLAVLVLILLQLVTSPLTTAVTRRMEAEADWSALRATRDPTGARVLFQGFAKKALEQPDPPGWWRLIAGDHPTIMERIEMAREFQARRPRPGGPNRPGGSGGSGPR